MVTVLSYLVPSRAFEELSFFLAGDDGKLVGGSGRGDFP